MGLPFESATCPHTLNLAIQAFFLFFFAIDNASTKLRRGEKLYPCRSQRKRSCTLRSKTAYFSQKSPTTFCCQPHGQFFDFPCHNALSVYNQTMDKHRFPLFRAALDGDNARFNELLSQRQSNADLGMALVQCADNGLLEHVEKLLSAGALIDWAMSEYSSGALLASCRRNHSAIAQLLLERGADPKRAADNGDRPLDFACLNGDETLAALLISKGADPNEADPDGYAPLSLCARNGVFGCSKLLASSGASLNAHSGDGRAALWQAAANGYLKIAAMLVDAGADFSLCDKNGWSPSRAASVAGYHDIAEHIDGFAVALREKKDIASATSNARTLGPAPSRI